MSNPMTEADIEYRAERAMDQLDYAFKLGKLSQAEYDMEVKQIDAWAKEMLQKRSIFSRG